jgi:hypothetical protein
MGNRKHRYKLYIWVVLLCCFTACESGINFHNLAQKSCKVYFKDKIYFIASTGGMTSFMFEKDTARYIYHFVRASDDYRRIDDYIKLGDSITRVRDSFYIKRNNVIISSWDCGCRDTLLSKEASIY